MLSIAWMLVPQAGHADPGLTTEIPAGTRYTTTFRNDPMASPNSIDATTTIANTSAKRL